MFNSIYRKFVKFANYIDTLLTNKNYGKLVLTTLIFLAVLLIVGSAICFGISALVAFYYRNEDIIIAGFLAVIILIILATWLRSKYRKKTNDNGILFLPTPPEDEEAKRARRRKINFNYIIILSVMYKVLRKIAKLIKILAPDTEDSIKSIKKFPHENPDFTLYRVSVLCEEKVDTDEEISLEKVKSLLQGELTRGLVAGEYQVGKESAVIAVGDEFLPRLLVDRIYARDGYLDIDIVIPNKAYLEWAAYRNKMMSGATKSEVADAKDDIFSEE